MPFAITLRLDPVSAASIEEIQRAIFSEAVSGYAPHVTLAIFPDEAPVSVLLGAIRQLAGQWRALPITLGALGVFPGPPPTLWAAPVVTTALLVRRAGIHVALPQLPAHPDHRAEAWMPHVTLSGPVENPGGALSALLRIWRPVTGLLDRAELVRFAPAKVLESIELPERDSQPPLIQTGG
jgi:2'-5' RNA ligase